MSDSDLSAEEEAEVADESEQKETEKQLKPVDELKRGLVWRKIEVNDNLINVKGGFHAKFELAPEFRTQWETSFCTVV